MVDVQKKGTISPPFIFIRVFPKLSFVIQNHKTEVNCQIYIPQTGTYDTRKSTPIRQLSKSAMIFKTNSAIKLNIRTCKASQIAPT